MRDDGDAAFPAMPTQHFHGGIIMQPHLGMTLRDYFAGKAMTLLTSSVPMQGANLAHSNIASVAYRIADAMLAERAK